MGGAAWRVLAVLLVILGRLGPSAASEPLRLVPQLALTDLHPHKLAFAPGDETLLMVVNDDGRIDVFDLGNPALPAKITEIEAGAADAAFVPGAATRAQIKIVSGGRDGTVRLWRLDGTPAAEPFKAHLGGVTGVALSPDGARIASAGADGLVRLWTVDGKPAEPFKGHAGKVTAVAFSPDGTRLASAGVDGTVRLWTLDGKPAADPFKGHSGAVSSVAFSPDGAHIASGGQDGTVRLWTLAGKPAAEPFKGHAGAVTGVAFSPDGTHLVSGGEDRTVRLWTLDGKPAAEPFKGHAVGVTSVAFAPGGTRIASGGADGTVRLWAFGGKPAAEPFRGQAGGVSSVAFSPDGTRIVSGGYDGTVRLWTLEGRPAAEPLKGHQGGVTSVAFAPDGTRIVSGGLDGTVRVWTPAGRPAAEPFEGHVGGVSSVAYSPDDTHIVSGGQDGTVRLWTVGGKPAAEPFKGHAGGVTSVAFSPDGTRIVSGGLDGTVRLWTLDGKPAAEPFSGHQAGVTSVAFSPDGTRIASGDLDGTIRLWTPAGRPAAEPLLGHALGVSSLAFSRDGKRLVSSSADGTIRVWTADGRPAAAPFRGHESGVTSVAFSPDGRRILSGGADGTVQLWAFDGAPAAEPLKGHAAVIASLAFSPDGTSIASGGLDGTVRLWTLDGAPAAEPFRGHVGAVTSVAFAPDGKHIASGGADRTIRLWTLDGKPAGEPFRGHSVGVASLAFSSDGSRIVSGGADGTVRLWTLEGKPLAEPFKGHSGAVLSVAFSRDGMRVVSGGEDGTVRLWTLGGKLAVEPFKGHTDRVRSVAFSPDGTRIASAGEDGTVRLWTLDGKPAAEPFTGHSGPVVSLAFSRDGARLLSGGEDGTIWLWPLARRLLERPRSVLACQVSAGLGFVKDGLVWLGCSDRVRIMTASLKPLGEIFLRGEGLVAVVDGEGSFGTGGGPGERHRDLLRAVDADGEIVWQRQAVSEISAGRVRQVLLDQWTFGGRIVNAARRFYETVAGWYHALGWLKLPFWPVLLWLAVVLVGAGIWVVAPSRLAAWAIPVAGSPPPPRWIQLLGRLTLFARLATTGRPLMAWLRMHRARLIEENFAGRQSVTSRERFCDIMYEADIGAFLKALRPRRGAALVWITGAGGSGKSALAYRLMRGALEEEPRAPLPILVEEDWTGTLFDQVARQLTVDDRRPTPEMVEALGARRGFCLVLDSLSERGMADAVEQLADVIDRGVLRAVVVTSRQPLPAGPAWERFQAVRTRAVPVAHVPDYVAEYVAEDRRAEIEQRLAPLIAQRKFVSPLFLRFAIEQAAAGEPLTPGALDLVLRHVEALRAGRLDLGADDMLRAASIAATESVRDALVPRELDGEYLRGVLVPEADDAKFMSARADGAVDPAVVVDLLVACGLLRRNAVNRRLQFADETVAEQLAARRIAGAPASGGLTPLRQRIRSSPGLAIARAMAKIEPSSRRSDAAGTGS
jgi:WD40 repeat protein